MYNTKYTPYIIMSPGSEPPCAITSVCIWNCVTGQRINVGMMEK